jgi:RNA 2',3'-cyclic 3'-phosphodiesterase
VRLFIALNLPAPVREAVWAATAPVREREFPLRWIRPEGLHLTLKFLGEVPEDRGAAVDQALGSAAGGGGAGSSARGISLSIGEFGAFPDPRRPRVVWVGVAPDPALELLQHRVEQAFGAIGFLVQGRPFRPHITLARVTRGGGGRGGGGGKGMDGLGPELATLHFTESVLVESVEVMRSTLERGGAVYQVRRSVPLV